MGFRDTKKFDIIAVTGPTASGKTALAAALAARINGEVISADSRQVYRRMDIGTGKDLGEYCVDGKQVPYHMVDIIEPGEKYNVFEYQRDFMKVYKDIKSRGWMPVVCGGSGMYIDSILTGYNMFEVPPDAALRISLEKKSMDELIAILKTFKELHNTTDVDSKKRAIRAIEIAYYHNKVGKRQQPFPRLDSLIIGVMVDRETRRIRISKRLAERLEGGMIEEVKSLLNEGIEPETLIYYGLEYKYITNYLLDKIGYEEMVKGLEIAIHQFAKRQMTWFRGMEKRGTTINWIDGSLSMEEKLGKISQLMSVNQPVAN